MESQLLVDIVADLTARPPRKAKQSPRHRLRRFEHLEHSLGVASPGRFLLAQLPASRWRQPIESRAAVVLGDTPGRLDASGALEPVQCFVERCVLDLDDAIGALPDPTRDGVAMHLAPKEGPEDEHVERALEQIERFGGHAVSPYQVWGGVWGWPPGQSSRTAGERNCGERNCRERNCRERNC